MTRKVNLHPKPMYEKTTKTHHIKIRNVILKNPIKQIISDKCLVLNHSCVSIKVQVQSYPFLMKYLKSDTHCRNFSVCNTFIFQFHSCAHLNEKYPSHIHKIGHGVLGKVVEGSLYNLFLLKIFWYIGGVNKTTFTL